MTGGGHRGPGRTAARPDRSATQKSYQERAAMGIHRPEIDFPGGEPPAELQITDIWEGDGGANAL